MNDTLFALFQRHFPADLSRPVLLTPDGRRWSYRELEEKSARYARFLHDLGVQQGDRVAAQVDKSPAALFLYLACLRAGFIYLPLNTAYQQQELDYFFGDARPAAVIGTPQAQEGIGGLAKYHGIARFYTLDADGQGTLDAASQGVAPDFPPVTSRPDDVAAILYTSGTTGRPKGALLTHRNLASNGLTLQQAWGFRETDVLLHALPIFHVHGLFVACHCVLLSGARMLFLPRFEARLVLESLPHATVFMGVPTYYTRLLEEPSWGAEACRGMRLFISGSAPLQMQTFEAFRERSGHTLLERYGMTEAGMITSNPLYGIRKPGTVGPPLPGVAVRVVDEADRLRPAGEVGEVQIQGPNVFKGYWGRPEKSASDFTADGWFRTGDLGRFDSEGYLSLVGRSKDLVISGGYNVYPKEIENLLDGIPGVQESAVIGLPDPDLGERVCAVVVRTPDSLLSAQDLIEKLKRSVAHYKVPKQVFFAAELPRNAMGKVQKNQLRERYRPA